MKAHKLIAALVGGAKVVTTTLASFTIATSNPGPAQAAQFQQCERPTSGFNGLAQYREEAECACEVALQEDTIEALEAYLEKYPFAPTACRALALNALGAFAPGNTATFNAFGGNGPTVGYGG